MSNDQKSSNDQIPISDEPRRDEPPYDLEERTALFGEAIIAFARTIPRDVVTLPLISQLVRAGTSIGANCCEADDAVSRKEFLQKINTCQKEARETKHWLRMVVAAEPGCEIPPPPSGAKPENFTLSSAPSAAPAPEPLRSLVIGIWNFFGHWALDIVDIGHAIPRRRSTRPPSPSSRSRPPVTTPPVEN